ncbi:MAG: ABC transporter substrate-binding protein [Alphaproteobacteria bacterium]|nr:ABC transporter substrate-binding protein [Alphaproteobacteria bacterium]
MTFFFKPLAGGGYDRELPLIMGLMPVLPKHYWAGRAFNATTLQPPLGSGPYKIASVDAGRSIVFEKVKNHWAKDLPVQRGMYYFDAIRIDYFRDENVATEAMLAGRYDLRREADAARWATGYPPHVLEKSGLMKNMLPHGRVVPFRGFVLNTRRDMFSDRRVRMALGSVLDFGWLNKNIWYGTQKRTTSIFDNSPLKAPPTLSAASMALAKKLGITLPHDEQNPPTIPETMTRVALREKLKAADALLHQAGYNLKNGQRITPQGKPFIFDIVLNDPADEKIALSWAQQLKILGIFPTIRTMDSAQYQQALNQFNYDVVVAQWINSHSPGNEQMVYWGSAAASQPGSRNYAGVNDARVDKIAAAIPATETREDLVAAAQLLDRLIMAGYYVVPFGFAPADLLLHHKNLRFPEKIPLYGYIIESLWWQENMLQTPKTATQSAPTPANSK